MAKQDQISKILNERQATHGDYLFKLKNKSACIVTFLKGKDKKILNLKNCYDIGKIVAEMHSSTKKIKLYRKNSMGIKNLNPLFNSIKFKSKKFTNIEKFLKINFIDIKKKWPKKLPNGIIHGDLFIDNIFRFTQAGSEVSALLGRIPSAVGYQPTLATDMGNLQERITSTSKGSITSVQAIYVPADD